MASRSITTKYGVAICCVAAAAVLAMALTQAWFERASTLEQIRKLQALEAASARDKIEQYLSNLYRFVAESANLPWAPELLTSQEKADDFRRLIKLFPEISTLVSLSFDGKEQVFVDRSEADRIGDGRHYDVGASCEGYTNRLRFLRVLQTDTSSPSAVFLACAKNKRGGVILTTVNLEFLSKLVADIALGDNGVAYVVDGNRRLVAHPNVSLPRRAADFSMLSHIARVSPTSTTVPVSKRGVVTISFDGSEVVATVVSLTTLDWLVVVEQPTDGVLEPTISALNRVALIATLILMIAVAVSLLMTRFLLRPILAIREGVKGFAKGDLALRIDSGTVDELSELATDFNNMASQLQSYTTSLEQKVSEKTALLELANRHKSEFLANMSHELRTPLNAVIGFSDVLKEQYFGELNPKQQEYVKDINESGQHLLSLINDILDLSKIEAGHMDLDLVAFSVPMAIDNAMVLVRERALRHQLKLRADIAPEVTDVVADERKFKQILINLLTNAVKFSYPHGWVEVIARRDTNGVMVTVKDSGMGVAPEDHAVIFQEFRQLKSGGSAKLEGTGLGLSLAKRLVELHGGRIWVESALSQGASFTFTLPDRGLSPPTPSLPQTF